MTEDNLLIMVLRCYLYSFHKISLYTVVIHSL
nr:MAG TPA: hypothetical protein [Caudoviricetes sp.]